MQNAKLFLANGYWTVKPHGESQIGFMTRGDALHYCQRRGLQVRTPRDERATVRSYLTRGAQEARLYRGREFRTVSKFEPKAAPPAGRWSEK